MFFPSFFNFWFVSGSNVVLGVQDRGSIIFCEELPFSRLCLLFGTKPFPNRGYIEGGGISSAILNNQGIYPFQAVAALRAHALPRLLHRYCELILIGKRI